LKLIKNKYGQNDNDYDGKELYEKYIGFVEDALKGEKTVFYGIAYGLMHIAERNGIKIKY
jgi:hypothetical protein